MCWEMCDSRTSKLVLYINSTTNIEWNALKTTLFISLGGEGLSRITLCWYLSISVHVFKDFFAKIPLKWWAIHLDCSPWTGSFSNLRILPAGKIQVSVSIAAVFSMLQVHSGVQESCKAPSFTVPSFQPHPDWKEVRYHIFTWIVSVSFPLWVSEKEQRHRLILVEFLRESATPWPTAHTLTQRSTHHHRRLLLLGDRPPARPVPSSFVRSGSQWKRLHEGSWVRVLALAEVSSEAPTCTITLERMPKTRWMACD